MTSPTGSINSFRDDYFFLSNFYPHPIDFDGKTYPTLEHAYQAAKTESPSERKKIRLADSPGRAKKLGKSVTLRDDWNDVRIAVMTSLVRQKFKLGTKLARKLIDTAPRDLIEGNTWGDRFWGMCDGRGKNHLGQILMARRAKLIELQSRLVSVSDSVAAHPPINLSLGSRPQILHSSMSPFGESTQDLEFPSFPRSIGVIVRTEKRSPRAPETILVEQEWPTLTSVVRGEESDSENVEQLTRAKVRELVARCRVIAQELLSHASRLEDRLKDGQMVSTGISRERAPDNPQDRRAHHHNHRWGEHDRTPATRRPTRDKAPETPRGGKSARTSAHDRRPSKPDIDVAKLNRALSSKDDEDDD